MTGPWVGRRTFLASASAMALAGCATTASPADIPELTRAARLLYPHDALDDQVYREVANAPAASPDAVLQRADLVTALNEASGGRFVARSEAEQIAAMRSVEGSAGFAAFRSEVQTRLYAHPAVWALLGYPGPALPFGGYLDKGFDDIDWLPA